ncbi:MAG: nucleoside 2-deoxyribosyltransferase [Candidatus Promineifilaceae bacterium]|jgi:nucleoside 2-deoxyribosyltransferase
MLIYFAGPLFNQAERAFNLALATTLEEHGYQVFLPQRDGLGKDNFNPISMLDSGMPEREVTKRIFTTDRDRVLAADVLLFVLDGRIPDEGACVELGIAYGQKYLLQKSMLLIGLHTDWRWAFQWAKRNAMIDGALDYIVEDEEELLAVLASAGQADQS